MNVTDFLSFFLTFREQHTYSCGRNSVIWDVQPLALKANISARVAQLAEPKPVPEGHQEQSKHTVHARARTRDSAHNIVVLIDTSIKSFEGSMLFFSPVTQLWFVVFRLKIVFYYTHIFLF